MQPDPAALLAIQDLESKSGKLLVRGVTGAGIHLLASALEQRPNWTVVELRDRDHWDATAALILEASINLGTERTSIDLSSPGVAAHLTRVFNDQKGCLGVIVPRGWELERAEDAPLQARLRALFTQLGDLQRLVVLAPNAVEPRRIGLPEMPVVELAAPTRAVKETSFPLGPYAEAAERLQRLVGSFQASPLVWRLAVGVMALGAHDQSVAGICQASMGVAISHLVGQLASRLRQHPLLLEGVHRLMSLRRPISPEDLAALTGLPTTDLPLLTHCVGYGTPVRTSHLVRDELRRALEVGPVTAETHLQFAALYRHQDGVPSPADVKSPTQMSAWIERAHHLAHAGPGGASEWATLALPSPEFYWDRARFLSRVLRDFEGAAALYAECKQRFPQDDYAAHYVAHNRWKAGQKTAEVSDQYAHAVSLSKDNPRWNQRYIVSLIELERFSEARRAWTAALAAIDPDGSRSRVDPWLLENLHLNVAKTWNRLGSWHDALRTVGHLRELFSTHQELQTLLTSIEATRKEEWSAFDAWVGRRSGSQWSRASTLAARLRKELPMLPVPAASEGEDESAALTWSQDAALLTLEFSPDTTELYWYAADRRTSVSFDGTCPETKLSDVLNGWLSRISHA